MKYPVVRQQSTQPLCEIMAIAFAFSCFLAKDCTQISLDTTVVADHLKYCISRKEISAFPVQSIDNNCFQLSIQTYMADQICRKEQFRIGQQQNRKGSLSKNESVKQQIEINKRQYQLKRKMSDETVKQQKRDINKQHQQKRRKMLTGSEKQQEREKTKYNTQPDVVL